MWTEHTEYEEYHKLQLCTVFRYQHNNTLCKISSNYRYRKNPPKYRDIIFFQYRAPLVWCVFHRFLPFFAMQIHPSRKKDRICGGARLHHGHLSGGPSHRLRRNSIQKTVTPMRTYFICSDNVSFPCQIP